MNGYGLTGGYGAGVGYGFGGGYGNNCICSLPTLVILILIVLQFSKHKECCKAYDNEDDECEEEKCCCDGNQQIGNGILFIIALFFLSCAGCGRGGYGGY